jgi:PII-like signaling protein
LWVNLLFWCGLAAATVFSGFVGFGLAGFGLLFLLFRG